MMALGKASCSNDSTRGVASYEQWMPEACMRDKAGGTQSNNTPVESNSAHNSSSSVHPQRPSALECQGNRILDGVYHRMEDGSMTQRFKNKLRMTIHDILKGIVDPTEFPPINVFELDGSLYSLNNRRLYMWRVLACKGIRLTIVAVKRNLDDPVMQRLRFDDHRLLAQAPKWERHLSSQTGGLYSCARQRSEFLQ